MKSFWCPPSHWQILQMGVSRVDLLVQRRGAWSAWAVSCNASIYFKILYILKCFPIAMEGLFSHDCKGANKSSRTKWHLYTTWTNFYTVKKMNLLWWYFSGILRCGEKCTGPLESYPNLRKVTLRNNGLLSSVENPLSSITFQWCNLYIVDCGCFYWVAPS